jgi:hypothetical protein
VDIDFFCSITSLDSRPAPGDNSLIPGKLRSRPRPPTESNQS